MGLSKNNKDSQRLEKMLKNTLKKQRKCMLCETPAINSHLLQRKGVLNNIEDKGHIVQLRVNNSFKIKKEGLTKVEKVGINKAMAYKLFCNKHDTDVFKEIEKKPLDVNDYKSNLLFAYRALCSELHKKEISIDLNTRILNSSHFSTRHDYLKTIQYLTNQYKIGETQLKWYKKEFENEIFKKTENSNFIFKNVKVDYVPICASAIYSPIFEPHINNLIYGAKKRYDYLFINVIPQKNNLYIVLGYHKEQVNSYIKNYISEWENLKQIDLSKKLTDLVSTKIETWAISPDYFNQIDKSKIKALKDYWNKNGANLKISQRVNFDLFN